MKSFRQPVSNNWTLLIRKKSAGQEYCVFLKWKKKARVKGRPVFQHHVSPRGPGSVGRRSQQTVVGPVKKSQSHPPETSRLGVWGFMVVGLCWILFMIFYRLWGKMVLIGIITPISTIYRVIIPSKWYHYPSLVWNYRFKLTISWLLVWKKKMPIFISQLIIYI